MPSELPSRRRLVRSERPLVEAVEGVPVPELFVPSVADTGDLPNVDTGSLEAFGPEPTSPGLRSPMAAGGPDDSPPVAPGETLQFVHYARRGETLFISGITPHGRRLTFEQREDRQGWYVVAAGRRRRPTERELGLVVATITQEIEAALVPERQTEVRSAYRLAVASDQAGVRVGGLEAYRDLLLDECASYIAGITERLAVVAIDYQAFKRFANRHGHRVGAAFVQALGERLSDLYGDREGVHVLHKSGKSFRLIVVNHAYEALVELLEPLVTDETRAWIVRRVWGDDARSHPDEVHFRIGIAKASRGDRESEYEALAQRLSDDAYRASKLGQLLGHTSLALAKSDYRTTIYRWTTDSESELQELSATMDDGPAEVMAEMSDYLAELVPADLEGMAVAGDLEALLHCAIARHGFWQGTTAMRIAGERLIARALDPDARAEGRALGENEHVGGFDLGDEFYGISIEGEVLHFARGDINSAGATRVRAGLAAVQDAVGWQREDGRGIAGLFMSALEAGDSGAPFVERVRAAAQQSYLENESREDLQVNDAVDIIDFLFLPSGAPIDAEHVVEGAELVLAPPGAAPRRVKVLERRSAFTLRLSIDGDEHPAVIGESAAGLQVKLRVRDTVASAAVCVLSVGLAELRTLLTELREENGLGDDHELDVLGFLRHVTDILLEDHVKAPGKVELALGAHYDPRRFVRVFGMEDVREGYPGLFYEAVHMDLLAEKAPSGLDRELTELIGRAMLGATRPPMDRR